MDVDLISLNGKVSDNKVISYIKRTDLHVSQLFAYLLCCLKERKNPKSKYNTPRYLSISNKSCFKDTHYNLLHIQRDGIFIKYLTCNSFLFWNAKIIHFLQNKLNYLTMGWSIYNFPSEKYLKYPNIHKFAYHFLLDFVRVWFYHLTVSFPHSLARLLKGRILPWTSSLSKSRPFYYNFQYISRLENWWITFYNLYNISFAKFY